MTATCTATLRWHTDQVWACSWSRDSRTLATGSKDTTNKLCCHRRLLFHAEGHSSGVASCARSPDGRSLASGSHDGKAARRWCGTFSAESTLVAASALVCMYVTPYLGRRILGRSLLFGALKVTSDDNRQDSAGVGHLAAHVTSLVTCACQFRFMTLRHAARTPLRRGCATCLLAALVV